MAPRGSSGYIEIAAAAEKKTWKGHALVMPFPAQGHINPMMHLSHQLAAHGILVTFVNTQFNHDRILRSRASSQRSHTYDDAQGGVRLVGIPDGLGYEEYVAKFNIPKQVQALIDLEPSLVQLVEDLQPPVTCIIADVFVLCTPAVARRFDFPHVMFWTQSAASYASHVFFTQNHASLKEYMDEMSGEGKEDKRLISFVPSCPTMSYRELPTFVRLCDPSDFVFSCLIQCFQMASQSSLVLMNTFEKLEEDSIAYINNGLNIRCIGPVLPRRFILDDNTSSSPSGLDGKISTLGTSFWAEDSEGCLPWLDKQKPSSVLYVSFGSITLMSARQIVEFAVGLEASGCPFLMVVRPEMMEGANSVTFPKGFLDRMRDSGQAAFVEWAPQLDVLAHPAVGGFFTHAGWNSTLESLCRGVPMLCWPYFADQMLNVRCIVDTWKIGLDFDTEKKTSTISENSCVGNGDDDDVHIDTLTKDGINSEELVPIVKSEDIAQKIRQLMNPLTSIHIRKQVNIFSAALKRGYDTTSSSNFKALLDIVSH